MTIIALDSSTEVCSAALLQDGDVVAERINMIGSNHAALLPTYVQELQVEAASRSLTIGAVALSEGPGSYTGLRIGASLAKGLCYGMDVPLYAVPTLAVCSPATGSNGAEVLICPMIDARRMEVYCALYDTELREVQPLQAMVIGEQSLAEVLNSHVVVFCGNGAEKCKAVLQHPNAHFLDGVPLLAKYMSPLAEKKFLQEDFADVAYFEPNYLKEFQATVGKVKGLKE